MAAENERELSGHLINRGYGVGHADRVELFNCLSVELLCDYSYFLAVNNMDEKKRREFDSLLEMCGERTAGVDRNALIDQLLKDPQAEVEIV